MDMYFKIFKHASTHFLRSQSLKRFAISLDQLKQFSIDFPLQEGWLEEIKKSLLSSGTATKQELDSLESNVSTVRIDFKNEPNDPVNVKGPFKFNPSQMTASYGPYVVDDVFEDKTLKLSMADSSED